MTPLCKDLESSLLLPCRKTFLLSPGFANSQGNIFSVGELQHINPTWQWDFVNIHQSVSHWWKTKYYLFFDRPTVLFLETIYE